MTRFLLTMQYNEMLYLPVFLRHYSKWFAHDSIFVIDHGSDQIFPSELRNQYSAIRVPRDRPYSEVSRNRAIKHLCASLLQYFDYGIYVDCDELLSLDELDEQELARWPVMYVAGFDVYYEEVAGAKRLHGLLNAEHCKPLIFRMVPDWTLGFHGSEFTPTPLKLPLAHVRYLYRDKSASHMQQRTAIHEKMNPEEKARGIASHWGRGDEEYREFYKTVDELRQRGVKPIPFEPIDPTAIFLVDPRQAPDGTLSNYYYSKATRFHTTPTIFDLTNHFNALI